MRNIIRRYVDFMLSPTSNEKRSKALQWNGTVFVFGGVVIIAISALPRFWSSALQAVPTGAAFIAIGVVARRFGTSAE